MLYLSPFRLEDLTEIFPHSFRIKLLVCNAGFHAVYMDEYKQAKQFECLNRDASIKEIIEVIDANELSLYEYEIQTDEISIKTVASSNCDILVRFAGKDDKELYHATLLDKWRSSIDYKYADVNKFDPGILYDVSEPLPKKVFETQSDFFLTCFLCDEQNEECCENDGKWIPKNRIYYLA
ncbi:MAG: hypothetical protein K8R85_07185 [Bacteroidetes bacterium]|nr:hypothetical protein [Bacteroidota bacterium]